MPLAHVIELDPPALARTALGGAGLDLALAGALVQLALGQRPPRLGGGGLPGTRPDVHLGVDPAVLLGDGQVGGDVGFGILDVRALREAAGEAGGGWIVLVVRVGSFHTCHIRATRATRWGC